VIFCTVVQQLKRFQLT